MDRKTLYLAGGCFWGCQKYFDLIPGVIETEVGYANGPTANPTYQEVKHHAGHAETVRVVFSPAVLPLQSLLDAYFKIIDPTSVNRQGEDEAIQYRTPMAAGACGLVLFPGTPPLVEAKRGEFSPLSEQEMPAELKTCVVHL